ncbi:Trace amine-associated receptor 7f [Acropora cervicornis]|uniref:Trace amine-associated receptor 7f n=1 Tax=Acropora cervicornis TaxID=6130 RepID=A0AAD9V4U3_ACRCE|nr:Trace amine-associated receptor 7f [Acropora cervicornis]
MAMTNVSDRRHQLLDDFQKFCSAGFMASFQIQLIQVSIFNIVFAITAIVGNSLILVALHEQTTLHPPSKVLLRSLAAIDFCVGVFVAPIRVAFWMTLVKEKWHICVYIFRTARAMTISLCSVSLFVLTATSVDRFLALSLGLRYRQVVTLMRVYAVVITFWVLSIAGTAISFSVESIRFLSIATVTLSCLLTCIYFNTRIILRLRHHQTKIHGDAGERPNQIARFKKTVNSVLWLQFALVVCYLPCGVVMAVNHRESLSGKELPTSLAEEISLTLVYFNSSLNPILYCWKIKEVRRAVKVTLGKLIPRFAE